MWRLPRIHDRRGAVDPLVPQALSGLAALAAVGAAALQTEIPEHIDREMIYRLLTWAVGVLVLVVWWFVRRMYEDQKKRLEEMDRRIEKGISRLDDRIDDNRIAIAELKAVCPYAPVHSGAHLTRTPPHGDHQDSPHGDMTR